MNATVEENNTIVDLHESKLVVPCPQCSGKPCTDGFNNFLSLVQRFNDHTRQMQLCFISIEEYIQGLSSEHVLRKFEPEDAQKLTSVELGGFIYWIETLGHFKNLPNDDQKILLSRYSVRKISLDHYYSASKYPEQAKKRIFVLNNYTYVPADRTGFEKASDDNKQINAKFEIFKDTFSRFWTNIIDKFIELDVSDAEIVFLHHMLLWSPLNMALVSDFTQKVLLARRYWAVRMILSFFCSKKIPSPQIRLTKLLEIYMEIEIVTDQHCADMRLVKLFEFNNIDNLTACSNVYYSLLNVNPQPGSIANTALLSDMLSDLLNLANPVSNEATINQKAMGTPTINTLPETRMHSSLRNNHLESGDSL